MCKHFLSIIHGLIKRKNGTTQHIFVPLVYALMISKTEEIYVKMLNIYWIMIDDNKI